MVTGRVTSRLRWGGVGSGLGGIGSGLGGDGKGLSLTGRGYDAIVMGFDCGYDPGVIGRGGGGLRGKTNGQGVRVIVPEGFGEIGKAGRPRGPRNNDFDRRLTGRLSIESGRVARVSRRWNPAMTAPKNLADFCARIKPSSGDSSASRYRLGDSTIAACQKCQVSPRFSVDMRLCSCSWMTSNSNLTNQCNNRRRMSGSMSTMSIT